MQLATKFPGLAGMGVETAEDAAQFILLGSSTVQVCTGDAARLQDDEHLCEGLSDHDEHGSSLLKSSEVIVCSTSTHADLRAPKGSKTSEGWAE